MPLYHIIFMRITQFMHLPHAEATQNRKIIHVFVVASLYIQDISSQGKAKQK